MSHASSGALIAATTAATAGAIAAQQAQRMLREEEGGGHWLAFGPGWEFKIVRSMRPYFRRRDVFERMLQEEAVFGWQLVEKLDDTRVRLGRLTSERSKDAARAGDPYRTWFGMHQGTLVAIVLAATLGGTVLVIGLITLLVFLAGP